MPLLLRCVQRGPSVRGRPGCRSFREGPEDEMGSWSCPPPQRKCGVQTGFSPSSVHWRGIPVQSFSPDAKAFWEQETGAQPAPLRIACLLPLRSTFAGTARVASDPRGLLVEGWLQGTEPLTPSALRFLPGCSSQGATPSEVCR